MAPVPYESWVFRVAWESHPDDPAPIWSDETARVDGAIVVTEGRSDYNSTIQTSQLSVALRNHDQRFTPGNRESPLWPNVKPAKRCQVTDLVGSEEITVFDGFVELPEITTWQKSTPTEPREQLFNLTAVDRMGWLDRGRRFISTLGAGICATGDLLQAYYPLGDAAAPFQSAGPVQRQGLSPVLIIQSNDETGLTGELALEPASAVIVRGDDLPVVRLETPIVALPALFPQRSYSLVGHWSPTLTQVAGQKLTIVVWVEMLDAHIENQIVVNLTSPQFLLFLQRDLSTQLWMADVIGIGGAPSGTVTGLEPAYGKPTIVGMQFAFNPDTLKLWVDRDEFTDTLSGTPPASTSYDVLAVGRRLNGHVGHVQVYLGDYTRAMFLEQRDVGWEGLSRQRVDERIATVASYAGVPATELHLDRASAVMPMATLAGRRPGDVLRDAAAADNGQILAHGDGHLTFLSRGRRYNPPLHATVQLTWLEELAWRTDPPTNVADVSTTLGFEGHAIDAASVTEFGEYAPSLPTLDTAVDVDAANLAAYTVRYGKDPRQRASRMVFQLRGGTSDLIRGTVLRREIGDRVKLAGLPSNAPEGADMFHIEGMVHQISTFGHRVTWYTGPVVGTIPGVPDPLPKVGAAKVRSTTHIAY